MAWQILSKSNHRKVRKKTSSLRGSKFENKLRFWQKKKKKKDGQDLTLSHGQELTLFTIKVKTVPVWFSPKENVILFLPKLKIFYAGKPKESATGVRNYQTSGFKI